MDFSSCVIWIGFHKSSHIHIHILDFAEKLKVLVTSVFIQALVSQPAYKVTKIQLTNHSNNSNFSNYHKADPNLL